MMEHEPADVLAISICLPPVLQTLTQVGWVSHSVPALCQHNGEKASPVIFRPQY